MSSQVSEAVTTEEVSAQVSSVEELEPVIHVEQEAVEVQNIQLL